MNVTTFMAWFVIRLGKAVDNHSGYNFPWSPYTLLPYTVTPAYHDYHHLINIGNYCSFFRFWDNYGKSNVAYD